jgi:hypothetical protein
VKIVLKQQMNPAYGKLQGQKPVYEDVVPYAGALPAQGDLLYLKQFNKAQRCHETRCLLVESIAHEVQYRDMSQSYGIVKVVIYVTAHAGVGDTDFTLVGEPEPSRTPSSMWEHGP